MGRVITMTEWCVREALAFSCMPASAVQLARQLDEPLRAVRAALSDMAYRGDVRYVGHGQYVTKELEHANQHRE